MKVLVLSVTAGQGHNSCGRSIMAALERLGVKCQMLDSIKYINKVAGGVTDKGYLAMGKLTPSLWKSMFENAVKFSKSSTILKDFQGIDLPTSGKLLEYIENYAPDCIICTHVFPSLLLSRWRAKGKLDIPIIGVNTDFMLHPFWEDVIQDYIVLACDKMDYAALLRGISKEQILPWGIPVHEKFSVEQTPEDARAQLGFENKNTILLMSGSMGFGNMQSCVAGLDALPYDFQVIVVCGSNARAYSEIASSRFEHTVLTYGFTNDIDIMMRASDIICTKPGGLSTSEALCVGGRPIVLTPPIPGLEDFNAAFLVNCGAVVQSSKYYSIEEAIYNLLSNPARVADMLRAQEGISPRGSADKLARFVISHFDASMIDAPILNTARMDRESK